jgi:2,3-bisphosphoglycerate-independent phosphoglycerate mutase
MTGRRILFIFLDGVGLGPAEVDYNPFVSADIPCLIGLLNGQRPVAGVPPLDSGRARFIPTDACLGVAGAPQSATGQGAIVTGLNVPRLVGEHWGPRPNAAVADIIRRESLFARLKARGQQAALLNAYPQRYFDAIRSGRRIHSAIPMAVTAAGIPLLTTEDLRQGRALSADLTGEGWRTQLGVADAPLYSPAEAGRKLAELAGQRAFSFFEYWLTDYAGHRGTLAEARRLLERLDAVLASLLQAWDDQSGLIVITSDHGNLEALGHRHHTRHPVPTFVIGADRAAFAARISDLTHFAPAILEYLAPA